MRYEALLTSVQRRRLSFLRKLLELLVLYNISIENQRRSEYTMSSKITISRHAELRIMQRCGYPKCTALRIAEQAYQNGIRYQDMDFSMQKWIDRKGYRDETTDLCVYGNFVYLFREHCLVTVLMLPRWLCSWSMADQINLQMQIV